MPVLVVDDDEITSRNTCERLKELRMITEEVRDGRTAVAKVEEAHANGRDYFAVILDYRMPGLDGVETARLIREKVGDGLPILMLSAYDMSEPVSYTHLSSGEDSKIAGGQTGDQAPLVTLILLALCAAAAVVTILVRRRRKQS